MSRPETLSAPASAADPAPDPELTVVVTLYDEVGTLDERGDVLGRVLEVAVHGHDDPPSGAG